jgi:photosystem II stability/assembly factor-like uncharacterized protein
VPLALHPQNSNIIYAALADGQPSKWRRRPSGAEGCLIQSTDGGRSWEKLDGAIAQADKSFIEALSFDPADSDRLYAAQRNGDLFGSWDSGGSWFKLDVSVPEISDMKAACA